MFDCSISDTDPLAASAETEDKDNAAPDEDATTCENFDGHWAGIGSRTGPNCTRRWKEYNWSSRFNHSDDEIMSFD